MLLDDGGPDQFEASRRSLALWALWLVGGARKLRWFADMLRNPASLAELVAAVQKRFDCLALQSAENVPSIASRVSP